MKVLNDILKATKVNKVIGNTEIPITGIVFDSRKVNLGCLFVAVKGTQVDGHQFMAMAVEMGAKAIICENFPDDLKDDIMTDYFEVNILTWFMSASEYDNRYNWGNKL